MRNALCCAALAGLLVLLSAPPPARSQDQALTPTARARELNRRGEELYRDKRYALAADAFFAALRLLPRDQPSDFQDDVAFNLANARQMQGELRAARTLYEGLLRSDPARAPRYHEHLDVLEMRERQRWAQGLEVKGNARLVRLTRAILPRFQGLRHSIEVRLLTDDENNARYLKALGSPTQWVPISESATIGGRHLLLYNASFWAEADDAVLTGNLAHELMHREWEDLRLQGRVFDWTESSLSYASLEHVIDYCVLGKGLERELYQAKAYLLAHTDERYLAWDIAPNVHHLADVLTRASQFRMPGRSDAIPTRPVAKEIEKDVRARLAAFAWRRNQ